MRQNNYTFILPVWNESSRIERTINYYHPYGRIIVIDNFSTDNTANLAKELGCEVVQMPNNGTIQTKEWMSKALALSPTSYVVLLSCSEYIPPDALLKFEEIARANSYTLVTNVLISFTCGKNIQIWNQLFKNTERRTERFFNRDYLDYTEIFIHAPYRTVSETGVLDLPNNDSYNIIHLRDSDITSLTYKHFDYASAESKQMISSDKCISLTLLSKRILADIIRYILLPRSAKGFIAAREVWARVLMNISIYYLVREESEGLGIEYSRMQSNKLWKTLVNTNKSLSKHNESSDC